MAHRAALLLSNVAAQVVEPGDGVFQSRLMDPNARTVDVVVSPSTAGKVKAYRPVLFKRLRHAAGVAEDEYACSLDFVNDALACLSADSKSGQAFWVSKNGLVVVKTIKTYECRNMREILDSYADHVLGAGDNVHTCISPVLGLYRVTLKPGHRRYFMVSKNVYPPGGAVVPLRRYDLKGSTVGRRAKPPSQVLKDLDLMASGLSLGLGPRARTALLRGLERDAVFLRSHGFMDYSLLVAVEPPSDPEDRRRRFGDGGGGGGGGGSGVVSTLPRDQGKLVLAGDDGHIYHFGVIDFLQRYSFRKVLETLLKSFFDDVTKISCIPPTHYARRMLTFIAKNSS